VDSCRRADAEPHLIRLEHLSVRQFDNDSRSQEQPLIEDSSRRLTGALHLLVGFFVGCVQAAAALTYLGGWAWSFPDVLAGVAVTLRRLR
jgi:hypothetical protein